MNIFTKPRLAAAAILFALFVFTSNVLSAKGVFRERGMNVEGAPSSTRLSRLGSAISSDWKHFYSSRNLIKAACGVAAAGIFANTSIDGKMKRFYQESIRGDGTDGISSIVKPLGDARYTAPVLLGAYLLTRSVSSTRAGSTIGMWSGNSLRAYIVGVPPLLLLQRMLGSSRPSEGDSHWHPLKDDNGASGHSFIGAVPFIAAAKMAGNPSAKISLYIASALPGISRINDDAHYFSQAALGWWLAYLSVRSVGGLSNEKKGIAAVPALISGRCGVVVSIRF